MNPRVLIAEDNPDTRGLLSHVLKGSAYQFDFAKTGQQAIELYQEAQKSGPSYNLLILDNAMPMKTGVTVAEEIRDAGDLATPIIFFTALEPREIEPDAVRLHACVIYKPEATTAIISHIEKALSGEMAFGKCV